MIKLWSTPHAATANLAKTYLESHGIDVVLTGEHLAQAMGEIPFTQAWVELWVTDERQVDEALALLEAMDEDVDEFPADWQCPQCGEQVEGQFTLCWQCGNDRPALVHG